MTDEVPNTARARARAGAAQVTVEVEGAQIGAELLERLAERGLAVARREVGETLQAALTAPEPPKPHPTIIGQSAQMLALFKMLERVQRSDATVLVLGENGTGKELVARGIHLASKRAHKQFVATNCSAFNDNLLESEMFGHRRGAFTGAVVDKPGLFETADGGTFFMDEVGDMSPALQVKLLRVLQEGTFMPVGGTDVKKVDVRIVAATNRDLSAMVKAGTFREDLFYRLNVVSLRVPPLRERKDDIPVLVHHFLQKLEKREKRSKVLTPRTLDRLALHEWPGNVRELENEMERLWVLSGEDGVIDEDLLSPAIGKRRGVSASVPPQTPAPVLSAPALPVLQPSAPPAVDTFSPSGSMPEAVEALERRMIGEELRKAKGNKTKAADALGISRRNLIRKVQAYGLEDGARGSVPPSVPPAAPLGREPSSGSGKTGDSLRASGAPLRGALES
jgi:transcriptional regulator with PAS, ATPase and Fis domain